SRYQPAGPPMKKRMSEHHISVVASTLRPYVCNDLEAQRRFPMEEKLLQHGGRCYISLPLIKHGAVLGAVDFVSFERRKFDDSEVPLLQDVAAIVSIAVAN